MSTTQATSLLTQPVISAVFKPGQSMLGNHWRLLDGSGQEVGRTKRVYEGVSGKVGKRLAVLTGLSIAGSVTCEILDAKGNAVLSMFGKGGSRTTAILSDKKGRTIGSAVHEYEVAVTLKDAGGSVIGVMETPPDNENPAEQLFPVRDAAGNEVAAFGRSPHAFQGTLFMDEILFGLAETNFEAELLRHYGFRKSNSYTIVVRPGAELRDPLATMVRMLPALAGHLY